MTYEKEISFVKRMNRLLNSFDESLKLCSYSGDDPETYKDIREIDDSMREVCLCAIKEGLIPETFTDETETFDIKISLDDGLDYFEESYWKVRNYLDSNRVEWSP